MSEEELECRAAAMLVLNRLAAYTLFASVVFAMLLWPFYIGQGYTTGRGHKHYQRARHQPVVLDAGLGECGALTFSWPFWPERLRRSRLQSQSVRSASSRPCSHLQLLATTRVPLLLGVRPYGDLR
jgi:hypothetical protein